MAHARKSSSHASADSVARALGWFSVGLGLCELLGARFIARRLGMQNRKGLLRAYGARECATGIGILATQRTRAPWIWARVAGDALDIATLATHLNRRNPDRRNVGWALGIVAAVTAADVANAAALSRAARARPAVRDYSDRSGFPRPPAQMRGAARGQVFVSKPQEPEPTQPRLSS